MACGTDFEPFWQLSVDLLCVAGFDGYFKRLSSSWTDALGYPLAVLLAEPYLDFVHPDDHDATITAARTLPDGRVVQSFCNRYRRQDGSYRWLEWNASPDPERGLIYAVAHDVTEQRAAMEITESLAAALSQAAEAIFMTDTRGTIIYCNQAFQTITGYSLDEALGRSANLLRSDYHADDYFAEMWGTISAGQIWHGQLHNRRRDGTDYVVKAAIAPVRGRHGDIVAYVSTQQDITAELELRQRLAQSHALATAGQLVTGVAHDFRNILAAMRSFIQLTEQSCDQATLAEAVADLGELAERGDGLASQLVAFARQETAEPEPADLNQLVREAARLLRRTLPASIHIELDLDDSLPPVTLVPGRMQQVLLNLAINARDAMPAGGHLRFVTRRHDSDATLTVSDTGEGIPPALLGRIFDPFFTTKQDRGGSGIGLATVAEIVRSVNGHIDVRSQPGAGTVFELRLPTAG